MFITSFGEQNITYKCCSNFLIHLFLTLVEVTVFIYMESTKLRRWCQYSTFRTLKTNQLMPEKQEVEDFQTLFA